MSILIKGIDLPKDDDFIAVEIHKDECRIYYTKGATIREKRGQAIQIDRPHGRLIDEDKFIESNECCGWIEDMTVETFNKLTPTILEAEEYDG